MRQELQKTTYTVLLLQELQVGHLVAPQVSNDILIF